MFSNDIGRQLSKFSGSDFLYSKERIPCFWLTMTILFQRRIQETTN